MRQAIRLFAVSCFLFSASLLTHADVLAEVSTTPSSTTGEQPVLWVSGQSGTTVYGSTTNPAVEVAFSTPPSTGDVLLTSNSNSPTGAPNIQAVDHSINVFEVATPGANFTDLEADIYGIYVDHLDLFLTVNASDGQFSFDLPLVVGTTSNNYVKILARNGETISSVIFGDPTAAKFYAAQDIQLSGVATPEPASIMLLLSGIGGAVTLRRRFAA